MVPSAEQSHVNLAKTETMTSVGTLLREARENQDQTIAHIAEELCLTQSYVRAIEADQLESLPGLFFYKSFVRQYAALLGVNPKALAPALEAITAAAEPVEETAAANGPAARKTSSDLSGVRRLDPLVEQTNRPYFSRIQMRWSIAVFALVLTLCTGFYAWWNRSGEVAAPNTPEAQSLPVPVPEAAVLPVAETVTEAEALPATETNTETNNDEATESSAIALKLSATERTWLSITANGRKIFSGILQPSESKTVSGVDAATVTIGNAAGIEIRWNGKPLGRIGGRGEVRTVRLTPENYEIIAHSSSL